MVKKSKKKQQSKTGGGAGGALHFGKLPDHRAQIKFCLYRNNIRVSFFQYVASVFLGGAFMAMLDDALLHLTPHSRNFQAMYDANPTWAGDAGHLIYWVICLTLSYLVFRILGSIND